MIYPEQREENQKTGRKLQDTRFFLGEGSQRFTSLLYLKEDIQCSYSAGFLMGLSKLFGFLCTDPARVL